mgnify:CR=1 FL=1
MSATPPIRPEAAEAIRKLVDDGLLERNQALIDRFRKFYDGIESSFFRLTTERLQRNNTKNPTTESNYVSFVKRLLDFDLGGHQSLPPLVGRLPKSFFSQQVVSAYQKLVERKELISLSEAREIAELYFNSKDPKLEFHVYYSVNSFISNWQAFEMNRAHEGVVFRFLGLKPVGDDFPHTNSLINVLSHFLPDSLAGDVPTRYCFPRILYSAISSSEEVPESDPPETPAVETKDERVESETIEAEENAGNESNTGSQRFFWHFANKDSSLDRTIEGKRITFDFNQLDEVRLKRNIPKLIVGDRFIAFHFLGPSDKFLAEDFLYVFRVKSVVESGVYLCDFIEKLPKKINWDSLTEHPQLQATLPFNKRVNRRSRRLVEIDQATYELLLSLGRRETEDATAPQLHNLQTRLISDRYETQDDTLQLKPFADAIIEIIRRKESMPPLNLAIIAPWGHGKTSIMRSIQEAFDAPPTETDPTTKAPTRVQEFTEWLRAPKLSFDKLKHPTVWFNPWRYQSSHQIWAGMGHAIITQLVAKLSPVEREKFWLALQWERIDRHQVRKDIYYRGLEKLIPSALIFLVFFIVFVITLATESLADKQSGGTFLLGIIGTGITLWQNLKARKKVLEEELGGKFNQWIREPDYQGEMGLYHHIHADLKKVFRLLVQNGETTEPAIVFIDDLDRCAPKVVAEVVEAINLVMNDSDLSQYCYFILGMDAEMVAASLDVAYKEMEGKFEERERQFGSIGWFFLDKFVQLPFFIPVMKEELKQEYLSNLFQSLAPAPSAEEDPAPPPRFQPVSPEQKQEMEQRVQSALRSKKAEDLEELRTEYGARNPELATTFIQKGMEVIRNDDPEIWEEVKHFSPFLNPSPRSLKRFANLLRFYHIHQRLRELQLGRDADFQKASTESLAHWLLIGLRWPQLVRWVQWENETRLMLSRDCLEKARFLDEAIHRVADRNPKDTEVAYPLWIQELLDLAAGPDSDGGPLDESALHSWMRDKELFHTLYEHRSEANRLEAALHCGVW